MAAVVEETRELEETAMEALRTIEKNKKAEAAILLLRLRGEAVATLRELVHAEEQIDARTHERACVLAHARV